MEGQMAKKYRYTMDVTEEFKKEIEEISSEFGIPKSEVIRRAIALLKIAHREIRKGNHVGAVQDEGVLKLEFLL
jgi:hypothetical protein